MDSTPTGRTISPYFIPQLSMPSAEGFKPLEKIETSPVTPKPVDMKKMLKGFENKEMEIVDGVE